MNTVIRLSCYWITRYYWLVIDVSLGLFKYIHLAKKINYEQFITTKYSSNFQQNNDNQNIYKYFHISISIPIS